MSDYTFYAMTQRPLFQVTLSSGRVVTREEEFGEAETPFDPYSTIFSEDGRVLSVEADAARKLAAGSTLHDAMTTTEHDAVTCERCNGSGWWKYDHNHSQPCPSCCEHSEGWWKLSDSHGASEQKFAACYRPGCGTTITHNEWDALPGDLRHDPLGVA